MELHHFPTLKTSSRLLLYPKRKRLLISPAVAEMGGIFPIVREEDMDKLNAKKLTEIYKEISLSPQQLNTLCDQLFKKK